MRLQFSALSVFLSLTSAVSASSLGSITEGVAGAIIGSLGAADGESGSDSPVPHRRCITELAAEAGPQWDLYLQALRSMHDRDSRDPESFFQIAAYQHGPAIHGRPFMEYNNAGAMNTNGWGGYSPHDENLFVIWHRAFVVLFEQILVKEAKKLAASYPDDLRSIYQKAADDLRAPYWDWALEPWVPSVALPETIEVKVATKTGIVAKSIENPLYTYRFPEEVTQGRYGAFDTYERTHRCQNPDETNQNLYSRNYKSWLYDNFVMAKSFSEFSTTASKGGSLEGVHDAIHWDFGCGGQFMNTQYAAFEPLFMLHHCNVDRLWAYWQAMHPEAATFNGAYQGLSRFNTPDGTMIGLDSPLQPFRQTNGDWHTPRSVNSITTFGYSYQGLEYWTKSDTELQQSAVQIINSLYGPEQKQQPTTTAGIDAHPDFKTTETSDYKRFYARISVDVSYLPVRPCSIEIFIDMWRAGGMVIMQMPEKGVMYDSIPLCDAIASAKLGSVPDDELLDQIVSRLHVTLRKTDGSSIDVTQISGLRVDIEIADMVAPTSEYELPQVVKSSTHVALDNPVSGCAAPAQ
ncbi:hypothetical protein LLEC1_00243 [Akanthomyces lecanii]|uniref:tyrosinase n=1 Tax=Cordyceps confragosa TaxID=2714763 RepID=A0A179IG11_CORDF|nr:hypothetical protein LLEC1_00243 [Akanthomyces lecanii]